MAGIAAELYEMVRVVAGKLEIPPVEHLWIPPRIDDPDRDAEFAVLALADGSTGFFFAWLGDTLSRLRAELDTEGVVSSTPLALCERCLSRDEVERGIGLAAVSAVSQHLFRRAGHALGAGASSVGRLRFAAGDHVGMVGLFPSLSRRLVDDGVRLTVIERNPEKLADADGFEVSLDPARLGACNKVLCTASTLLNDTLDDVLAHCGHAEHVALIGPTAGCLPDPLFARGVHVVGGSVVRDLPALLGRLARDEPWGDAVDKYTLSRDDYPGFESLLARAR